jgi:hypothetical protein
MKTVLSPVFRGVVIAVLAMSFTGWGAWVTRNTIASEKHAVEAAAKWLVLSSVIDNQKLMSAKLDHIALRQENIRTLLEEHMKNMGKP